MNSPTDIPGSAGEHVLQNRFGTESRACAFYKNQVLNHLNAEMRGFIAKQEMLFVASADGRGKCDCSFRAGPPGFVCVLDEHTLTYPEYRGNGVFASLGNISENAHLGLLFVDFLHDTIGLHVNGKAAIVPNEDFLLRQDLPDELRQAAAAQNGRRPERWVVVRVDEAYIHCSKHIPLLVKRPKEIYWGTDDPQRKGGDYFLAKQRQAAANGELPHTKTMPAISAAVKEVAPVNSQRG